MIWLAITGMLRTGFLDISEFIFNTNNILIFAIINHGASDIFYRKNALLY